MPIFTTTPPITADEDTIRRMLQDADLPSLLPTLAQITGDLSLVADEFRPPQDATALVVQPQGGMSPETQERAREAALAALLRFRDGGSRVAGDPSPDALLTLLLFITGDISEEYVPLLAQELGIPVDAAAPDWTKGDFAPSRDFTVAIIGAGMSGLAAAHRLAQADVPFVVFERNADVGGVWLENHYPGCRLDTNNFAYSFTFAQKDDWPQQFSPRDAIYDYFREVSEELGLRQHIRFGTEVVAAAFDDATNSWTVRYRGPDGAEQTMRAQALVTAVGQLNRPNYPDVPGRDSFAGPSFHTARWDETVSLAGRRVAVIGTGASAYQVVPSIVDEVGQLLVFQRTPPWMLPTPTYHDDLPSGLSWLFRFVPYYHRWFRFYQFWTSVEGRRPYAVVDPEWDHEISISERNEQLRQLLAQRITGQYTDRPDLQDKVVPQYPPYAKRMLRDNGVWAKSLKHEHTTLITEGIEAITEKGIRTRDGVEHPVDVIIYGTGFQAQDFLAPIRITGRDGVDLHEQWAGDARAFLGMTIPGFPNLFCLYGPNTNLVVNASIIQFSEYAVSYVIGAIRRLLAEDKAAMECRQESFDAFNVSVDEANRLMAWGASEVSSWYKNRFGRVSQNWPFPTLEYWRITREVNPADYHFYDRQPAAGAGDRVTAGGDVPIG